MLDAGQQTAQRGHGLRALQGQKGAVKSRFNRAAATDACLDVCQVTVLASAVDDHKNIIAPVHEHQVVDDAAFIIQEQAVPLLVQAQADHVYRHQTLKGGCGIRSSQAQLAHVRHIKQASCSAGVVVFGDQTRGVLHRHAVASKRHHARAKLEVQAVQRGGEQIFGGGHVELSRARFTKAHAVVGPRCPLYLRDSPGTGSVQRFAPSVDAVVR